MPTDQHRSSRQLFSSRIATLFTMIGVSVGLGNVWRFPYMMGKYGGSAFLCIYIICVLFFAMPALMAEWTLGRETRKGTIGAFSVTLGNGIGKTVGYLLLFTVLVANSYYLVVIANVTYAAWFSISEGFSPDTIPVYEMQLGNGWIQYGIAIAILLSSLFVIYRGLNKGIETVSKLFIPFFGVVSIYLIVATFMLEGAPAKFAEFLRPDFSRIKSKEIFAAMGQAFFSVGLGGTFFVIYGSYLKREEDLPSSAIITGMGDMLSAFFASLFIIPSILVFGMDMTAGPTLLFHTLPTLFYHIPAGSFSGGAFLLALMLVAYLSNIAALEVLVGGLSDYTEKIKISRGKVILFIGLLEVLLVLPSALHPDIIETLDLVFGSGMQLLGSVLALIAVTWGLGRTTTLIQVFGSTEGWWKTVFFFWIRWVVPVTVISLLIGYIINLLS